MRITARIKAIIAATLLLALIPFTANATPLEDGLAAYDRQDYAAALETLTPLAQQGSPGAQCHLGMMHGMGLGTPADIDTGIFWAKVGEHSGYCSSGRDTYDIAKSGLDYKHIDAIAARARAWRPDPVPPESFSDWLRDAERMQAGKTSYRAKMIYTRLAESGNAEAQVAVGWDELGYDDNDGSGLPRKTPRKWFRLAAAQDHPVALRVMTLYGDLEALRKVQRLSETDPSMKSWLEQFYIEGKGVTREYRAAQEFWRKPDRYTEHGREVRSIIAMYKADDALKALQGLASKDDRDAQVKLSFLYTHGFGVKQDDAQAFSLAEKAARGESWKARGFYDLGAMYYEGRGVGQDFAQAYYWLGRAGRYGHNEDGLLRQKDAGEHLNAFEREVIDFKLYGIFSPHRVQSLIIVVLAGLFIIFFAGKAGVGFSAYRKTYIAIFILYTLFVTPLAFMDIFPHSHKCWPCSRYGLWKLKLEMMQGFLVIFCNWLVVYQLAFRKKTFWMKPLIGNFSEADHAKATQIGLLWLNAPYIVWVLYFILPRE